MWKAATVLLAACGPLTEDPEGLLPSFDGPGPPGCSKQWIPRSPPTTPPRSASPRSTFLLLVEGPWAASGAYFHTEQAVGVTFEATRTQDPVVLRTWQRPEPYGVETCALPSLVFSMDASLTTDDGAIDEVCVR